MKDIQPQQTTLTADNRIAGNKDWNGLPMPTRIWAILAVAFGVSLSVIDGSIANVALPTMARTLGISAANSIWIVNAYQLAIVVSLLSFSALGDLIGHRKIYIGGLVVFTIASLGCTLSNSLPTLVTARVCQGFGAAAVTSINTTLIRLIYPRHSLGRGMGINATVVAVSSVAGPTIASGILSVASWPWLFAINIPIGLIAITLSYRFLPKNPVRIRGQRFDWRDGVMNALTFGLLILSIEGYSHGIKPAYIGIGVILLVCGLIIPELADTMYRLSLSIPGFVQTVQDYIENMSRDNPRIHSYVMSLDVNWNQIGGPDALLYPYCRNNDSGSHAQMERHFLHGAEIHETIRQETTSYAMQSILTDVINAQTSDPTGYALGYSIYYYYWNANMVLGTADHLKLLEIDGVAPTDETIADGSYPLSNNTYVVLRKDTPEDAPARRLADFMLTEAGQRCVENAGYGPLQ